MIFLWHQRGSFVDVNGKNRKLSDFIKKIFICVMKMNKFLWVWDDMRMSNGKIFFLCELTL